jgi:hypothetical protein
MKPQEISDGLVMRNACAEDIPALLEHFRAVHSPSVIDELRALLEHYPRFSWEDSFIIVRPDSGEVVSCVILLQGAWTLGGISFPSTEMEAVGTLMPYRYRGHMHFLNDAFEKRVAELRPVIQAIAGIPYFYRNFGYEYAAALGGGYPISINVLPKLPEGEQEPVTFEQVDGKSFREFLRYREHQLSNNLSHGIWRREIHLEDAAYLLFEPTSDEQEAFFFYLVKEHGKTVGVFYLLRWENRLDLAELYLDNYGYADAALRFAVTRAQEWGGLPVRVNPPSQTQVREYVRARSSTTAIHRYAWYVKIPSIPRFIETLGPLLSDRLKDTEFHSYTGDLKFTDYSEGYTLSLERGRFRGITKNEDRDPGKYSLQMSRGALTRLLMGYEALDSIMSHEPDSICSFVMQPLVRLLFPKLDALVDPFY